MLFNVLIDELISDATLLRIGRMIGLENSRLAKKIFQKYQSYKMRNHHGIVEKEIQGSRIFLNLDDATASADLFFKGVQSFAITSCFYNEVKPNMTVFDIGANIGCYTFQAAKICGNNGLVIAFEPGKVSYELMQKSLGLNPYKNIKLINKAVSKKSGKGKLFLNPYTNADNRIICSDKNWDTTDVEIISVDDFIKESNIKPNFIKIDVQDAQYDVLDGMKNLLESKTPLKLVVEFSHRKTKSKMKQFISCIKQMRDFGFSLYHLKEPNKMSDVKSSTFYSQKIKNQINDFHSTGISKFDEMDILFVRK